MLFFPASISKHNRSTSTSRWELLKTVALAMVLFGFVAGCSTAPRPVTSTPAPTTKDLNANVASDPFWPADGVFPVPGQTSSWSGFRAKNVERRTLFASRRAQDQGGIVFVGDSITEGWHTLEQDFADLGIKVANRGIGGDTTPNLIYRLQDDVLSLHPRALVILIGTNDLGQGTTPAQIAANLKTMHGKIRAAYRTIPIAWCFVMPRGAENAFPQRIQELNGLIKTFVASDPRITLCDTFTPLALPDGSSKPEDYVPDRLHLNPAGYAVWRTALHPILEKWRLEPKR